MTGPEHYRDAAEILRTISTQQRAGEVKITIGQAIAAAQVHATLALAAATALQSPGGEHGGMHIADAEAWEAACSAAVSRG